MTGGKGRPAVKRGRAGGDIHPCPWPTGAHIPGEYAAAATRSYLRQNANASSPTALPLRNWRHLSDHAPLARRSIYEMRLA